MNVFVTVLTLCLRDFKQGILALRPFRNVALFANYFRVMAFERVFCCRVIFDGKCRGFEAVNGVARRTFTAAGSPEKLPFVRIFVAVHAFGKRYWCLEVPVRVAIAASYGRMFAQ